MTDDTSDASTKVRKILELTGWSQARLSRESGIPQPTISRILANGGAPGYDKMARLIAILDAHQNASARDQIGVIGSITTGGTYLPTLGQTRFQHVRPAAEFHPDSAAIEIDHDGLGPLFNGWFAVFRRYAERPGGECLGQTCVVFNPDARYTVRRIEQGSEPESFILIPHSGSPEINVAVLWAAPILAILPPDVGVLKHI